MLRVVFAQQYMSSGVQSTKSTKTAIKITLASPRAARPFKAHI